MTSTQRLRAFVPKKLRALPRLQTDLPRIAKDRRLLSIIEHAIQKIPTVHDLRLQDARRVQLDPESVHLVVTSPPYWTLKDYNAHKHQLGHIADYARFLRALDTVWQRCFDALVPGGRLVCVVGDVCLSRRKNAGGHTVVPLHASIQEHCRALGYVNLSPIIWHKIANATYEVSNGSSFMGKPYEPNAVIKNDIEFILMERKGGGYRKPSAEQRILSVISDKHHKAWFQQIWNGLTGASTRHHPAPVPVGARRALNPHVQFRGRHGPGPVHGNRDHHAGLRSGGAVTASGSNWIRNTTNWPGSAYRRRKPIPGIRRPSRCRELSRVASLPLFVSSGRLAPAKTPAKARRLASEMLGTAALSQAENISMASCSWSRTCS